MPPCTSTPLTPQTSTPTLPCLLRVISDRRQGGALSLDDTMPLFPLMKPFVWGDPSVWDWSARTNMCVCALERERHNAGGMLRWGCDNFWLMTRNANFKKNNFFYSFAVNLTNQSLPKGLMLMLWEGFPPLITVTLFTQNFSNIFKIVIIGADQ